MGEPLVSEDTDLDGMLTRLRDEHGDRLQILYQDSVRRGGVGGFFAREVHRIAYRVLDESSSSAESGLAAAAPAPASAGSSASSVGLSDQTSDKALDRADDEDPADYFAALLARTLDVDQVEDRYTSGPEVAGIADESPLVDAIHDDELIVTHLDPDDLIPARTTSPASTVPLPHPHDDPPVVDVALAIMQLSDALDQAIVDTSATPSYPLPRYDISDYTASDAFDTSADDDSDLLTNAAELIAAAKDADRSTAELVVTEPVAVEPTPTAGALIPSFLAPDISPTIEPRPFYPPVAASKRLAAAYLSDDDLFDGEGAPAFDDENIAAQLIDDDRDEIAPRPVTAYRPADARIQLPEAMSAADRTRPMATVTSLGASGTSAKLDLLMQLRGIGVPVSINPNHDTRSIFQAVEQVVSTLPVPPSIPREPGEILVLVGELTPTMRVADVVAAQLRLAPSDIVVVGLPSHPVGLLGGSNGDPSGAVRSPISSEREAQHLRAELATADRPAVVVLATDTVDGDAGDDWAGRMLASLRPTAAWLTVDATRKPSDSRAMLDRLVAGPAGEVRIGIDALAVHSTQLTATPATVWDLGLPIALLDGRTATSAAWAGLLLERLSASELRSSRSSSASVSTA